MAHLCAKSCGDPTKNEEKLMFPTAKFYKKDYTSVKLVKFQSKLAFLYLCKMIVKMYYHCQTGIRAKGRGGV